MSSVQWKGLVALIQQEAQYAILSRQGVKDESLTNYREAIDDLILHLEKEFVPPNDR